jgi:PEP-CTERM motif
VPNKIARIVPYVFVAGLLCLATPPPAAADDIMTLKDALGNIVGQTVVPEAGEDPTVTYLTPFPGDPAQLGNETALLEPPGGLTTFSDVFGVVATGNGFVLGFQSDSETVDAQFGPFAPNQLLETDAPFDATMYLDPALQRQGFTATFQSVDPTPEPTSLALMGMAGLGLSIYARMRRKNR